MRDCLAFYGFVCFSITSVLMWMLHVSFFVACRLRVWLSPIQYRLHPSIQMMSIAGKSIRIIVFLRMRFRLFGKCGWMVVKELVNSEYVSTIQLARRKALSYDLSPSRSHIGER